nr:hypothetical protein [Candidatus Woesearchaeota archaeon]
MKSEYKSPHPKGYLNGIETKWAEILSKGNAYAGMLLLYDQKLCALAYEVEVALEEGKIKQEDHPFYASRLKERINTINRLILNSGDQYKCGNYFSRIVWDLERMIESNTLNLRRVAERIRGMTDELVDELLIKLKE